MLSKNHWRKLKRSKTSVQCEHLNNVIRPNRDSPREHKEARGPLTTEGTNKAELFWVKWVRARATADKRYQDDLLQLNLQPNTDGMLECHGRMQGHYPIYLPDDQRYTEKLLARVHLGTLHGGELVVTRQKRGSTTGCRG